MAALDEEFCRQHALFEMNVELKNNGCHELALTLPRSITLSVLKARILGLIKAQDSQDLLATGNSRFRGAAKAIFDELRNEGYEKMYARIAFASSFTGLSTVSMNYII